MTAQAANARNVRRCERETATDPLNGVHVVVYVDFIFLLVCLIWFLAICVKPDHLSLGGRTHRQLAIQSPSLSPRSDLNAARTSLVNSFGCSHAAKWPPLSSLL